MSSFGRKPINQYPFVFDQGTGLKGGSYRYTWKPDWRIPPDLKGSLWPTLRKTTFVIALCCIPVYVMPALWPATPEEVEKADRRGAEKQKQREDRMKWILSDDMPRK